MKIMKKKFIALMLVLVMVAAYLPTGVANAGEAVEKPVPEVIMSTGFEEASLSGIVSTQTSVTQATTEYHGTSGHSMKFSNGSGQLQVTNGLAMTSGESYTVSFWYKCEGASNLKMRIGARGGSNDFWDTGFVLDEGNNGWTKYEYTKVAIANQTYLDFLITGGSGVVYIDDLTVSHNVIHNVMHVTAVEATEETAGNYEYWYCVDSGCNKYWSDEACTTETTLEAITIPKLVGEEKTISTPVMSTGFEEADQSAVWGSNGSATTRVDTVYHGASGHSLKFGNGSGQAQVKNGLSMVSGETYTVSFWYKCEGASNLKMRIGARGGENDFWHGGYVLDEGNNGWTKYAYTKEAIANQTYIDLYISGGTGIVYVDDLTVTCDETHMVLHKPAKEATTEAAGNYEYWKCTEDGCDKVWSNADCTVETTLEAVTIPQLVPETKMVAIPVMATGFEETDQSAVWGSNGSATTRVDTVYHGASGHSLKFGNGSGQAQVKDGLSMVSGETYTVSFWYKCEGASNLKMRIGARGGENDFWHGGYVLDEGNNGWTKYAYTKAAIANQTYIDLYISGGTGIVYVDDLAVTRQESHTVLRVPAKAATTESTGNVQYWTCTDAGYEDLLWSDEACTQLTTVEEVTIPMLPASHTVVHVPAAPATTESTGNIEYWKCTDEGCGKLWLDAECTQETTLEAVTLPKLLPAVTDHTPSVPNGYYPTVSIKSTNFDSVSAVNAGDLWFNIGTVNDAKVAQFDVNKTSPTRYIHTGKFSQVKGNTYKLSFYAQVRDAENLAFDVRVTNGSAVDTAVVDNLLQNKNTKYTTTVNGVKSTSGLNANTADWQLVEVTWVADANLTDDMRIVLTGNGKGTVYVDDLVLYDATPVFVAEDHTPNVPSDYYSGTFLKQTDFDTLSAMNASDFYFNSTNHGTVTENKVAKFTVNRTSITRHLHTGKFSQVKGNTYKLSFYALVKDASGLAFDVRVTNGSAVDTAVADNLLCNGNDKYKATINGVASSTSLNTNTADWQLIEITWTADANLTDDMRIVLTGNGKGTVYVDDLVLQDITPQAKGVEAEIELKSIARSETQYTLTFTGNYPTNTNGWRGRSNVQMKINGKEFTQMFIHEANEELVAYISINSTTRFLEEGINTIVIPADSDFYMNNNNVADTSTPEFYIKDDYTFYTQKVAGNWMDWSSDYTYPEGKDVQYVDMGTGKDYVFSNTTSTLDAGAEGVIAVTKDGAVVYSSSNDGTQASYTTKELGVYEVVRTVGRERYQYKVVLYKRGNTHSALALGESADVLDARDLVSLKKAVSSGIGVGLQNYKAADANVDGAVNTGDVSFMRRILAGDYDIMATQKGQTIFDQGTMPIIGHGGADPATTNDAVIQNMYQLLGESGINMFVSPEVFSNSTVKTSYTEPALRYADANGLKLMLKEPLVANEDKSAASTVTADTLVKRVGQHNMYNSFAGLYVADEPTYSSQATAGGITKYAIDNYESALQTTSGYANIHSYLNLFPADTTVTNVKNNYENYVKKALTYQAEAISYDMYYVSNYTALINTNRDRQAKEFYTNLDKIRTYSGKTPFWTYVQAGTDFGTSEGGNGTLPTRAELYFEANAALAMGAKGINYFRVVRGADYVSKTNGLITQDGQKVTNSSLGDNYNYFGIAQDINRYIAKVDHILMGAENKGVIAMNSTVKGYITGAAITSYNGTTVTAGNDAFVGCFDYYGENVYLVCNTNTSSTQSITLNFGKEVSYISTGMDCQTSALTKGTTATFSVPAGESVLVEVK